MVITLVKKKITQTNKENKKPPLIELSLDFWGKKKKVTLPLGECHSAKQAFSKVEKCGHPPS